MSEFWYCCILNCFNPTNVANKCRNYFSGSVVLWFLYVVFIEHIHVSFSVEMNLAIEAYLAISILLNWFNSVCDEDLFLTFLGNQPYPIPLCWRDKQLVIATFD